MGADPFAILGLPRRFDLDEASIERAYLSKVGTTHPDVIGDDDDAAVRSAQLNQAKTTLLDLEKRANALLAALEGSPADKDHSLPDGFLLEIMETREAVEAAIGEGNAPERAKWRAWALAERALYFTKVSALFQAATDDAAARVKIRRELNAWRYIERLIEQLDPKYNPSTDDFKP